MKKITLTEEGTLEHLYIEGVHNNIPAHAIDVSDSVFMDLSQNTETKKYDLDSQAVVDYIPAFDLALAQLTKEEEIKSHYYSDIESPTVDANNIAWSGGFNSAIKLDAAIRLAQTAGSTSVTFFDNQNNPHTLTFDEATTVVLTVASTYQSKLAKKNQILALIKAAENQTELDEIIW